ncbi:Protein peste [Eumeta japonica]|uniref:Protein peste n=1 Tax=Eumeta variegata TaxID=151549 RepID=A0A4C1YZA4_EUMVA|nr:Protein peste [Eumeta japonica]
MSLYAPRQPRGIVSSGARLDFADTASQVSRSFEPRSSRLLVQVILNIITLLLAATLSLYPWIDHFMIKDLMSKDGRVFALWRYEESITSKSVYFFNVTNPEEFLEKGEKLKLVEFGPFVIEHKKAHSPNCSAENTSTFINQDNSTKPFISLTLEQLLCGYGDTLHYPNVNHYEFESTSFVRRQKAIESRDIYKFSGSKESLQYLGYINTLGSFSFLPQWTRPPCTDIRTSEGFLFPPRDYTKSDTVRLYDEHVCRVIPLEYKEDTDTYENPTPGNPILLLRAEGREFPYRKIGRSRLGCGHGHLSCLIPRRGETRTIGTLNEYGGLRLGLYSPPSTVFDGDAEDVDNSCYCLNKTCPPKGLQDVSPCYDGMPVYVSFPHFYGAEPSLLDNFEGLQPEELRHRTYFEIQPTVGVSMVSALRVQFNVKLTRTPNVYGNNTTSLPDVYVPIMWIERVLNSSHPEFGETTLLKQIYAVTVTLPLVCKIVQYLTIVTSVLCLTYLYVTVGRKTLVRANGGDTFQRVNVDRSGYGVPVHEGSDPPNDSSTIVGSFTKIT